MSAIKWRRVRRAHNLFETDKGSVIAKVKVNENKVFIVTAPGAKNPFAYLGSREEVVEVIQAHMKEVAQ